MHISKMQQLYLLSVKILQLQHFGKKKKKKSTTQGMFFKKLLVFDLNLNFSQAFVIIFEYQRTPHHSDL